MKAGIFALLVGLVLVAGGCTTIRIDKLSVNGTEGGSTVTVHVHADKNIPVNTDAQLSTIPGL